MTRNADGSKTKTTKVTKGGTTATRTKTKSVNKSGKVRTATKKKTSTVNTPAGSATVKKTKTFPLSVTRHHSMLNQAARWAIWGYLLVLLMVRLSRQ